MRDARIAMIYEGANGIQALDLVGRKLPRDGGRAVMSFFGEVAAFAKEHGARRGHEALRRAAEHRARPSAAGHHLADAECDDEAGQCRRRPPPTTCSCSASSPSPICGRGWRKSRKDKIAGGGATPYLTTKLVTGRFFMERMLPETSAASRAHPDRKRDHHGIGGGSFLTGEILPRPAS